MSHVSNRRTIGAIWLALLTLSATGCGGRYALTPAGQPAGVTLSPQQQTALAQQTQQYQQRAASLDRDNQELESMLAQSRQQTQLLQEQITATQTQLRDTTDRLAAVQADNDLLRNRTTALAASVQTRSQAEIRANNSLLRSLTITNMPGINVRQDGDVIRIELPGDQLFNVGTAQPKLGADALLRTIAVDLAQNYPQQLIGIEGHTDGSPMTSPQYPTDQHLAVAQAMAVYDGLARTGGMPPRQLFVVGHGASHPLVSNGTDAGRARNRRIEVVIYPETIQR
ncbi:MAG: OmpA family protein [Planctomycetes bacterium]|nr:OmpA family protein [Planctomycetota bacterium]